MSTNEEHRTQPEGVELAAGGLVWSADGTRPRLAVVHRPKHSDWTLPKGRPESGENLQAVALREVMEETGRKAFLNALAGSYCYMKGGRVKVVLAWHMTSQAETYEKPARKTEIDRVVWLLPDEAISRLTHAAEREFVARHCKAMLRPSFWARMWPNPRRGRLEAALQSSREHFVGCINRSDADADVWWGGSVRHALDLAEGALDRGDIDGGWRAVHDAERFIAYGMKDGELIARAMSLKAETRAKLRDWRFRATESLWNTLKLVDWQRAGVGLKHDQRVQLEQAVVESLHVLNEHSDNLYHRMLLVGKQLNYLVVASVILLICTGIASAFLAPPDSQYTWVYLSAIAIAGALGGVASAMYQLSRVGEAKVPEALLYGLITLGRPLVGAASALFIYGVLQSGIINLLQPSKATFGAGLVLGFVAGFSEQFVFSTVAKVSGGGKDGSGGNGKPRSLKGDKDDGDESVESLEDLDSDGPGTGHQARSRKARLLRKSPVNPRR